MAGLLAAAACASDPGLGEGPPPPGPQQQQQAAPRWVSVARAAGEAATTTPVDIAGGVLQWRVTVTCRVGHVRVGVDGDPDPLVDQGCPGRFFGFSILTGRRALTVEATGPWDAVVEQQVDHPAAEPPAAGMSDGNRLASGSFAGVEQDGWGTATLYRLPNGRRALRLAPFFVTANDDLFVWASEAEMPRTSAEALFSPHVQLEALRATAGEQNYLLPDSLPPGRIRSIVIWCEPVRTAYAAAPLRRR